VACAPENRLTFFDPAGFALGQTLVLPADITISP
jgi:hypothetical protein